VASERLTRGQDAGGSVTPGREKKNFRQRLDTFMSLVRDSMSTTQYPYERAFSKRIQAGRETLRVGDSVFVYSHKIQKGKPDFKALGPYPIMKKDRRRLTIKRDGEIRTKNNNHSTWAPTSPGCDPGRARALAARRVPSLPSSASKPSAAVFNHFFGRGYDEHERRMLQVRWFGYGRREDSWYYVEDLPSEKVRKCCQQLRLTVRRRLPNN